MRFAVNLPNSITLIRICMIPLLMWVLSTSRLSSTNGEKEILASALFIAASITDGIDGYIARRRGQITTMGILLDPLADKLLIAAAFITLVQFNPRLVPAWIAVVIIGREFLVSGLRAIAASEGFTIEASDLGKFKMFVQIVSVVAVILDHRWQEWPVGRTLGGTIHGQHLTAVLACGGPSECHRARPTPGRRGRRVPRGGRGRPAPGRAGVAGPLPGAGH